MDVGAVDLNSVTSLQMYFTILEAAHGYVTQHFGAPVCFRMSGRARGTSDLTTCLPGYLNLIHFQAVLRLVSKLPIFAMNMVVLLRTSVYPVFGHISNTGYKFHLSVNPSAVLTKLLDRITCVN